MYTNGGNLKRFLQIKFDFVLFIFLELLLNLEKRNFDQTLDVTLLNVYEI